MQEAILGISLVGFSTMISVMVFNSRKNDSLIRNLCERIAKPRACVESAVNTVVSSTYRHSSIYGRKSVSITFCCE